MAEVSGAGDASLRDLLRSRGFGNRQDERREGSSSSEPPSPESGSYGVTTEL
jgi:hypothetical protein